MVAKLFNIILLCLLVSCSSLEKKTDDLKAQAPVVKKTAIISFDQTNIKDNIGNKKFYQKELNFYNRGIGMLEIDSTSSSCNCSSVKIIRGNVQPMSFGTLQLSVNTEGFYEQLNTIKFKIYCNAKNSPFELFLELEK